MSQQNIFLNDGQKKRNVKENIFVFNFIINTVSADGPAHSVKPVCAQWG